MTGYEKIAVLLTELGSEASEKILSILKLSPAEMNKISKAKKRYQKIFSITNSFLSMCY